MTLTDLASIGSFVSGVAVVVSLIVAIIEIRKNTREVRAASAWNAEVSFAEFNEALMRDPALAELVARTYEPGAAFESFTPPERAQLFFGFRAMLQRMEAQWFLARQQNLPPEEWQKRRMWTRALIELPVHRQLWEADKRAFIYTDAFVREIESAPPKNPLEGPGGAKP